MNRLKIIRKYFKLTQPEFGKTLGVSRDVINNIELDRVAPKELFINYLCLIYNINKDWFLTGDGDMFLINEEESLKASILADLHDEDLTVFEAVNNLLKLEAEDQKTIFYLIKKLTQQ